MDDESIIELYLARSEEAVARTQIKYGRLLTRVASNILRDSRDAEEAVRILRENGVDFRRVYRKAEDGSWKEMAL